VRQSAAEALGECETAVSALPRLIRCAFDGDPRVRQAAAMAARRIFERANDVPVRPLLESILRAADPLLALRAAAQSVTLSDAVREVTLAGTARRLRWRKEQGCNKGDGALETPADPVSAAEALARVAGLGEVVWLLGIFVEAVLGERESASGKAP
jgi:hypothetical protein